MRISFSEVTILLCLLAYKLKASLLLDAGCMEEEEDKVNIQKGLSVLTDRLREVNKSLVRKTRARLECDKAIQAESEDEEILRQKKCYKDGLSKL